MAELEDAEAAIASLEAASQSPHLRDCIHSDSVPNSRKSEVKRQLSCGFLDDDEKKFSGERRRTRESG